MKITSLGGHKSINSFVSAKLARFNSMECSFLSMFELMFSEKDNIFYEKSLSYKIEYTTYGEAYNLILSCTDNLIEKTSYLPKNSVIGLYMDNDLSWIVSFWSIIRSGHRPLLLNLRLGDDILREVMDICKVSLVIAKDKGFDGYKNIMYDELTLHRDEHYSDIQTGEEILVMTSGTTSVPKVCAYSAEELRYQINSSFDIISKCRQIKKHYKGHLKLLTFLPFYHIFGFIAVYVWFCFFSRTLVHLGDFSAQTILNTIRRHEVTHIFAVPMFWNEVYKQAIKTIKARGEDTYKRFKNGMAIAEKIGDVPLLGSLFVNKAFSEVKDNLFGNSIVFMITGGSEISYEVLSFFNNIGYRLANGYGMSEIGITSVELSPRRSILNKGFVGVPLDCVEYSIDKDGILQVRSKSSAKYIIEGNKALHRQEWFRTGDLAKCVNGHYLILGRNDDLVIGESGENLNPCLIEPLLNGGSQYQVCLIGTKENEKCVPTLLVYAGNHPAYTRYEAVREKIVKLLEENSLSSMIGKIVFVEYPLILDGDIKINRTRLKNMYDEGVLKLVDFQSRSLENDIDDEIFDYIKELFAVEFGLQADDIGPDMDFFLDCGGSSLDYFAMISKLREEYDIQFPVVQNDTLSTVRKLYEYVKEAQRNVD